LLGNLFWNRTITPTTTVADIDNYSSEMKINARSMFLFIFIIDLKVKNIFILVIFILAKKTFCNPLLIRLLRNAQQSGILNSSEYVFVKILVTPSMEENLCPLIANNTDLFTNTHLLTVRVTFSCLYTKYYLRADVL
jgi:hypothetical protein